MKSNKEHHDETFASLIACPDISKEDQTHIWVGFYAAINNGLQSASDAAGVAELQDVTSANLGEPADEELILNILRSSDQE
jgi:hypothetical protein